MRRRRPESCLLLVLGLGLPCALLTPRAYAETVGQTRHAIVTEGIRKQYVLVAKGALTAAVPVLSLGNAVICGHNHSADTPYDDGTKGRDSPVPIPPNDPMYCHDNETGPADLAGIWSTDGIVPGGAAGAFGSPALVPSQGQAAFYTGPWDCFGMTAVEFWPFVGVPRDPSTMTSWNGILYLDNNDVTRDQSCVVSTNSVDGEGFLYVDGDLHLNSNFHYKGFIFVEGDLSINGNAWVLGGIVVRGKTSMKANGGLTLLYSSGAITQQLIKYGIPLVTLSPGGAFADSAEFFDDSSLGRWHLTPFGDLRLRHDRTQDIPGRTVDVDRWRLTARGGASWAPTPRFGAELSVRAAAGSKEDQEFPRIDNDAPDTLQLDRAGLWVTPWPGGTLRAGQMEFPLRLTELVWDPELRPIGIVAQHRQAVGAFDVMRAGIGAWRRSKLQDDGLVGVAQAGWSFHEGAERSGDAFVSYVWFEDTEWLARQGLGRQNSVIGAGDAARYAENFRLVDMHFEGRITLASIPVSAGVDLLRNLEPGTETDAARTRLVAGRFGERLGAEVGWAYLRAEREALPGAFASDDWWARTATRGHMPWVTLGWSRWLRLRVFGTFEWRDGVAQRSDRLVGELSLRWNTR